MLCDTLSKAARSVSGALKQTEEHKAYMEQKKIIRSDPETRKLIERARFIQEKLMEIPESDRNSDYVDQLQDEYEELTENTAVYEYMRVESVYVTMVQETLGTIVEDIDIDL